MDRVKAHLLTGGRAFLLGHSRPYPYLVSPKNGSNRPVLMRCEPLILTEKCEFFTAVFNERCQLHSEIVDRPGPSDGEIILTK